MVLTGSATFHVALSWLHPTMRSRARSFIPSGGSAIQVFDPVVLASQAPWATICPFAASESLTTRSSSTVVGDP